MLPALTARARRAKLDLGERHAKVRRKRARTFVGRGCGSETLPLPGPPTKVRGDGNSQSADAEQSCSDDPSAPLNRRTLGLKKVSHCIPGNIRPPAVISSHRSRRRVLEGTVVCSCGSPADRRLIQHRHSAWRRTQR